MQGICLAVLLLTRTISTLKLQRPGFGLTERCVKEEHWNIRPECFCSFRWFKNDFLIVNTKIFETLVRYRSKMECRLNVDFKCVHLLTVSSTCIFTIKGYLSNK